MISVFHQIAMFTAVVVNIIVLQPGTVIELLVEVLNVVYKDHIQEAIISTDNLLFFRKVGKTCTTKINYFTVYFY